MFSQYVDLAQTLALYCIFPYVTAYVTLVTYGLFTVKVGGSGSSHQAFPIRCLNFLGAIIPVYLSFCLPVIFIFYTYRGVEGLTLTLANALLSCNVKWVLLLLSFFYLSLVLVLLRHSSYSQNRYSVEVSYAYIFLFLAWFFVSFSTNVLTFLLALEVVTLLLILLMCNLWLFGTSGYSGFRANDNQVSLVTSQAQYALISVVLSFV
jgi:hypothetical protein